MAVERLAIGGEPVSAELLPSLGGRIHRLRAFGHDLLRTPGDLASYDAEPFTWGAYPMAPWCNRIEAMPTLVAGREVRLASNIADGSAIHGEACARSWDVLDDGTLRASGGVGGWPWSYETTLRVTVSGAVVRIDQTLTNLDDAAMPGGLGLHPWFVRPVEVRVRAAACFASNLDTSALPVAVAGPFDLRAMAPMADDLDGTWVDLAEPAVELRWPILGIAATLRAESTDGLCIVAASPARLDAVAIEPQTHAPQGLRRILRGEPYALHLLAPGEVLRLSIELSFRA